MGGNWRPAITPREVAEHAARTAAELRATDITLLDVRELSDITDYFVICTCESRRQMRALRRRLLDELKRASGGPVHDEGEQDSPWILIDLYDVVVHLFDPEAREFYDLELLWGDAPRVPWIPAQARQ